MRSSCEINMAIRRRPRDSIDFDIYRTEATALRGYAMRDAHALRIITAGALVLAGVLGFAVVVPAATSKAAGGRAATEISHPSQTH
jgi:hypothetical protein